MATLRTKIDSRHAAARAFKLRQSIAQLQNNPNAPDGALRVDVIELLHMLRASGPGRGAALAALGDVVATAYGNDGSTVGRAVRETGALPDLRDALSNMETRENALLVLSNLVSDAVDAGSKSTKNSLMRCEGAADELFRCFESLREPGHEQALAFACGALQNLCHERDWAALLLEQGINDSLEGLIDHSDPCVARYATGALKNMATTLQTQVTESHEATMAIEERTHAAQVDDFKYRRSVSPAALARHVPHHNPALIRSKVPTYTYAASMLHRRPSSSVRLIGSRRRSD